MTNKEVCCVLSKVEFTFYSSFGPGRGKFPKLTIENSIPEQLVSKSELLPPLFYRLPHNDAKIEDLMKQEIQLCQSSYNTKLENLELSQNALFSMEALEDRKNSLFHSYYLSVPKQFIDKSKVMYSCLHKGISM
jgi:hypothetical protein